MSVTGAEILAKALGPAERHVLSDVGNGQLLVRRHGGDLRYVHPWSTWLVWDGAHWKPDDVGRPAALMKETLRWLAANANEFADDEERKRVWKFALNSERAGRVHAALAMAQSEHGIPVVPGELDRDPWILNVQNGTINLRTGQLRRHDRNDLATRLAPVRYEHDLQAPRWEAFLDRVLGGDADLIRFVQRAVGYSLTGTTDEQVILILWGAGANGKSTFINTILAVLGDYAQQAPAETFLDHRGTIPNDVARLRGARMVAAAEIEEGRRLNEALIKRMTGGDKIAARFMRAEWFEFTPQFTPWLATNHKPEIVGTDLGIWRRVRLVPFTVTIPELERDQHLAQKLHQELPGILAWAVRGCLDWQTNGLTTPDAVLAATAEYRDEQDVIGNFLDECCDLGPGNRVKSSELHTRLGYWATANGHDTPSAKALASRLRERGFTNERRKDARWWPGISLRVTGDAS